MRQRRSHGFATRRELWEWFVRGCRFGAACGVVVWGTVAALGCLVDWLDRTEEELS